MKAQTILRSEERHPAAGEAPATMRELIQQDGVRRVVVSDAHGHTILEVPVRPDEVGVVMEPVVAAAGEASRVAGDVVFHIEREGELPAQGGTGGGGQQAATGISQADIDRVREANRVPEGSESAVERIEPEPKGDPELKGTGD